LLQGLTLEKLNETVIVKKIKSLRESKGFSQEAISFQVGIPLRTYQRIEAGDSSIKFQALIKIMNVLDPGFVQTCSNYFDSENL
jgi:transcriptional regulator with XRE-family HTH domain